MTRPDSHPSPTLRRPAQHILAGLCVVLCASSAHGQQWQPLGPQPILDSGGPFTGRLSSVAASHSDPQRYYVGAATGGVWRTLDGGASWTPLTDDMPTNTIGALALDPEDDTVVYAGTGEANYANHSLYGLGLYKSTDGGDTWTILGAEHFAGRTFSRLQVSPASSDVLFAAVARAGGFPALNAAKGHPLAEGPVGLLRSTDGGINWTLLDNGIPTGPASDLVIDPNNPATVYAAIGNIFGSPDNGVYKSTNGGDSWTELSSGLPANPGRISLAVAPSDSNKVYALVTRPSSSAGGLASTEDVYRSIDGGATWSGTGSGNFQASYGWYLSTMIVDPTDADTFFAGGVSLLRSVNGGANYMPVTPPHVDVHGLAYDASGALLCANDGGLHRSQVNGGSWQALTSELSVVQFYAGLSTHPEDAEFIIGGTQDNGTNLRRDNGNAWTQVLGADGGYTSVRREDPDVIFAEFQGTANLFRSDDGGAGFTYAGAGILNQDRDSFLPPHAFVPDGSGAVWFATHRIYRSDAIGEPFAPISEDLTGGGTAAIRALAPAPSNADTLYAATNDGRVLVSADGGSCWDLTLTGAAGWPRVTRELAVDPLDPSRAYLALARFGTDRVLRTIDHGRSWEAIGQDLPDVPVNTVAVHRPAIGRLLFAGTDRGIWLSCDDGLTWQPIGSGMPHSPVIDLIVDTDHDRLIAATLGRGVWTLPLPGLFDANGNGQFDLADFAELQVCFTGAAGAADLPPETCARPFDLDANGAVDLEDYRCGVQAHIP